MKILLFILTLFFAYISFGQIVQGRVIDGKKGSAIWSAIITLSTDKKSLVEITNDNGEFRFDKVEPGKYLITFSSIGYSDTSFNQITIMTDTLILLEYNNYCQYDYSLTNKRCPECSKKNAVIPIIYGIPFRKNGKDPTKGNGKKFILAGCGVSYCDPHWYCKRDELSF